MLLYVDEEIEPAALDRAVHVTKSVSGKLTLAAVVKPSRSQVLITRDSFDLDEVERLLVEDRKRRLEEMAETIDHSGLEIATRVLVGDPVNAIIRAVTKEGFDFVAKTPDPSHGIRQHLFGSVDMRLMRACPCTVAIGRPKPEGYSGNAVAAIDYDDDDETKKRLNREILDAVSFAIGAAYSEVHVVHAWSLYGETLLASGRGKMPPERFQQALEKEEIRREEWFVSLIDDYRATLSADEASRFTPTLELRRGDPKIIIPERVNELDADVLAMGTVGRAGISRFVIGNTAEAILHRVNCSVEAYKPEGFVTPKLAT
jgi:universal stress protein E